MFVAKWVSILGVIVLLSGPAVFLDTMNGFTEAFTMLTKELIEAQSRAASADQNSKPASTK